jgi:hypothetical protein
VSIDPSNIEGIAILQRIAAKALDDEDYRERLIDDPKSELEKAGLKLPKNVDVEIIENTPSKLYLVLPASPQEDPDLDPDERRVHHLINWWPV